MPTIHRAMPQSLIVVASTLALCTVIAIAATGGTAHTSATPAQVARMVDQQVQPSFQLEAGMFGEDRSGDEIVEGHRAVNMNLLINNKQVGAQPYFIIMGVMHVRHKPGSHIGAHDAASLMQDFKPSAEPLETSGTTDNRANRTYTWAMDNIGPATMKEYSKVKSGQSVDTTYGKFYVAIRPIKAEHGECITCHTGAHMGDTLGAMIYMVAPTPNHTPPAAIAFSPSLGSGQ